MIRISKIGKIKVIDFLQSRRCLFSFLYGSLSNRKKSPSPDPLGPDPFNDSDNIPGSIHFYYGIAVKYATYLPDPLFKSNGSIRLQVVPATRLREMRVLQTVPNGKSREINLLILSTKGFNKFCYIAPYEYKTKDTKPDIAKD